MTNNRLQTLYNECEHMLHTWREPLAAKNIHTQQALLEIIKLDFEKIIHAMLEAHSRPAQQIVADFFHGQTEMLDELAPDFQDKRLYHLGFEVLEPLDLVLQGFDNWFGKARQLLGVNVQVSKILRFPASQAFQDRVGAYTEIMRIWIHMDQRTIMLELFDIHHPLHISPPASNGNNRLLQNLRLQSGYLPGHRRTMQQLFHADPIWHYALYVNTPDKVRNLHARFQTLAAQRPHYRLASANPIENQHDKSFHTKLINQNAQLEIEFVTQLH